MRYYLATFKSNPGPDVQQSLLVPTLVASFFRRIILSHLCDSLYNDAFPNEGFPTTSTIRSGQYHTEYISS